ncbi:GNAT family N-acetyltransferase [Sinorhizobium meliloti]|nr:GNAT family N-acetyltransferase [Sinorhizobium meliloti]MDX0260607.1 GNAT family N-acetyltransferase [Sinorhizobium meliloti]MDX0347698.1 GNAT family N-acetyltransferase [Sinorhizobium meliloti]
MNSFQDKKGRTIHITVDLDDAAAWHNGKQIGFVTTTGLQDEDERLAPSPAVVTGWEVDEEYRQAGIATAMVEALVEQLGKLAPAEKNIGIGGKNALTDEGVALTRHCQKLNLMYEFPDEFDSVADW